MNKREQAGNIIGNDPATWSRTAPLPPIPSWFAQEHDRLASVVHDIVAGETERAQKELDHARDRDEEMRAWYRVAIWVGTARADRLKRPSRRDAVPRGRQDRKLNASGKRLLFERDGYRCRYCARRIIPEEALVGIGGAVGEDTFRVKGNDTTRRGASLVVRAVEDHVVPLSRGGKTLDENLVTACYPCNFSKAGFTLEQLGLDDPRDRGPVVDEWDGFVSLLSALRGRARNACR